MTDRIDAIEFKIRATENEEDSVNYMSEDDFKEIKTHRRKVIERIKLGETTGSFMIRDNTVLVRWRAFINQFIN
jgi:hypothetical protein